VQVSKHPAFQMFLDWGALQYVPIVFSEQLPRSSRTLPIAEPFCCPKRNILPPFAMWLAFPTSDYYGGSATEMVQRPVHLLPVVRMGLCISASPVKNVVLSHCPLDSVV
jgi:hypothetical protein